MTDHTRQESLYVIRLWWNAVMCSSVVIRDAFADSCCFHCLVCSMWKNNRARGEKKTKKQMMNHSVHNRDVCIQLYRGVCRPFIISGQSLQKHSRTDIPPSLPSSLAPIPPLSVLYSPQSLTPLAPAHFPSFLPLHPKPPPSSVSSLHLPHTPRPHLLSVSG